ncbi:MAG TPA: PASTA domain-containing protein [Solirubrobacteraceae bacterium]
MSVTRIECPRCHAGQPSDLAFCSSCGEYLLWPEDTPPAPEPEPPPAPPPPPKQPIAVQTVVHVAGTPSPDDPNAPLETIVAAGGRVELLVRLRNVGDLVDTFTVSVDGLPAAWVQLPEPSAHLLPVSAQGDFEQVVHLGLHPPRAPSARAGRWPFTISVTSEAHNREVAARSATLVVEPFYAVLVSARPQVAQGRRTAHLWCDVRNNGNAPIAPTVHASDADEACTFVLPAKLTTVAPGQTASLFILARARKPHIIGFPRNHRINVSATVEGVDPPPPPQIVGFRQRPLIPWWVPLALALLAALAIAIYALWPREVTMPALRGSSSAFVAQRRMQRAGLKTAPVVKTRVYAPVEPGTVLDQTPPAGRRVSADTTVTLRVAAPPTFTKIPDLRGLTIGKADGVLERARLRLGNINPKPSPTRRIVRQVPLAGRSRPRGTAVAVFLGGVKRVEVPKVLCLNAGKAEKALNAKGFQLGPVPQFIGPHAKALGQIPAAGTKRKPGSVVTLIFRGDPARCAGGSRQTTTPAQGSAVPLKLSGDVVAFDDGDRLRLTGASAGDLGTGAEAAWSPDGELLAARVGGRLVVRDLRASPPTLGSTRVPGTRLRAPAFAPRGGTLAFLARARRASSMVCFVATNDLTGDASCLRLPLLARTFAWTRDARTLLVVGARPSRPRVVGVLRVTTPLPGAADAEAWQIGGRLARPRTPRGPGNVLDVAVAPNGRTLALVTDISRSGVIGTPRVVLTAIDRITNVTSARWPPIAACHVSWSPRGDRLAVTVPDALVGCVSQDQQGPVQAVGVDGRRRHALAAFGSHPAWRPNGGSP